MSTKQVIALDAVGMLLDYNSANAVDCEKAFEQLPTEKYGDAYWAIDRWDVRRFAGYAGCMKAIHG